VVRIDVSQPLVELMSQSSKPAAQVVTRQVPVAQVPVPPAGAHSVLQDPQSISVVSGDSQPVLARPSQSPQLRSQVST
jgi:hypothetical protein